MDTLTLYDVTSNAGAAKYFLMQLEMGTSLSTRIKTVVDFAAGRMFVALPDGTNLSNLPKFEETGPIRWRRRGFATLAHLVKCCLAINGAAVLIQDTIDRSTNDEWIRDYQYRQHVASYNQEVYWQITDPALDEEDILGLIYSATFHPWSGFFYVQSEPGKSSELSDVDLNEIARTLSGVAVGVFDQESFLLWWSNRLPLPSGIKSA